MVRVDDRGHYKVFVSYSTKDIIWVEYLKDTIKTLPIDVFIADKSIQYGESIPNKISQYIKNSDLFLLIWTENSKDSSWVNQEIGKASENNVEILPIVLSKNLSLTGFIQNLKYVSLYGENKFKIGKFIREKITIKEEKKRKDLLKTLGVGAFLLYLLSNEEEE